MKREDIVRRISEISSRFFLEDRDTVLKAQEINLDEEIVKAHQDWIKAQNYFQSVSDPELVDHAIFVEEAARRKYMYLLKRAKKQGITLEKPK